MTDSFSVRDNNSILSFQFNGETNDSWPATYSTERFYGRKCMEFEWQTGSNSLLVGVSNDENTRAFFFANFSNVRFETRKTTQSNQTS